MMGQSPLTYDEAGVSVETGDRFARQIKALTGSETSATLLPALGGYAAVYPVSTESNDCIATTTDGVGTKVLLADEFKCYNTVGIDLVAMCANDLICVGAKPTLFLDYFATGKLDPALGMQIIEGIHAGCRETGMVLAGGETAEMPDVYTDGHFDLAGFSVGMLTRARLLSGDRVQPGQWLLGLASSGIHSNGLSLARKVLTKAEDRRECLIPTRLYVRPILEALQKHAQQITGIANITGGGWHNMLRLNATIGIEVESPLPVPRLFKVIEAYGVLPDAMYETFNMGVGMIVSVDGTRAEAESVAKTLNQHTPELSAQIIGHVTDARGIVHIAPSHLDITLHSKKQ